MSAAGSLARPRGIRGKPSACCTTFSSVLLSGSPGTMAGPVSPPRSNPSRESTRRPAIADSPWHAKQLAASSGRILVSNSVVSCATGVCRGRCLGRAKDGTGQHDTGHRQEARARPARETHEGMRH